MKLFVKCTRNGADCFISYEGQDQDTVTRLLTELEATNIQFMAEADWTAARPPGPTQDRRSGERDAGEADQHTAEGLGLTNVPKPI